MSIIVIGQVISAVAVIVLILLQDRSSGVGGAFGGGGGGGAEFHSKRRGMEKILFNSTIVFTAVLIILSVLNLVL